MGIPATFTLTLASTLEPVGSSVMPPRPSTTTAALGMIIVLHEFLEILVTVRDPRMLNYRILRLRWLLYMGRFDYGSGLD